MAASPVPTCGDLNRNNFEHMPELSWTYGYPLCLAVIGVLCIGIYWRFKRSGWL